MKRALLLTAVATISAAIWIALLPRGPILQPIPFDHSRHTDLACVTCHLGAERAASAGIPDASLCLKCHATPPRAIAQVMSAGPPLTGTEARTPSWDELVRGGGPAWTKVTRLPDHVMFTHRRHVGSAKLECASCHAEMGTRRAALTTAPVRLDMNACLSCHRSEGASEDCVACHR